MDYILDRKNKIKSISLRQYLGYTSKQLIKIIVENTKKEVNISEFTDGIFMVDLRVSDTDRVFLYPVKSVNAKKG